MFLEKGPVAAKVNGSTWSNYKTGIFNNCPKRIAQIPNHAVLIVGYDE